MQELRENLLSQMEEKEQSLGRPLATGEVEEIIRDSGPPFLVAARFGPHRSLIGPALFPFYWLALKWGLLIGLIVRLIEATIRIIVNSDTSALFAVPGVIIPVFAATTAGFAGVEWALTFANVKMKKINWNPRSLPKLHSQTKMVRRSESVAAIIFGLAGLVWLRSLPNSLFLGGWHDLVLAPIWSMLYWFLFVLVIATVLRAIVMLVNPYWATFSAWSRLAIDVFNLIAVSLMFRAGTWFSVLATTSDRAHWEAIAAALNQTLYYGLLVTMVAMAVNVAWDLYPACAVIRVPHNPMAISAPSVNIGGGLFFHRRRRLRRRGLGNGRRGFRRSRAG